MRLITSSVSPPDGERGVERHASMDMVGKALSLLHLLGEHPGGAHAAELAREAGFPLSTAHRLLGALVRDHFVDFDSRTRQYELGLEVFALGQSLAQARGFAGTARPVLEHISNVTGEATLLAVLDGDQLLYVHYVSGPRQVSVIGRPGRHGPLHCTALGKVLVAFAPSERREKLLESLELPSMAPNTITDRQRFRAVIADVYQRGWATADEEYEVGIRSVATVVQGPDHFARAAISAVAPAYRTSLQQLLRQLPLLTASAREIATRLPTW